jgi:hypothetical protein
MKTKDMNVDIEKKFCKEFELKENERKQYIYSSTDNTSLINLPYILLEYKEYLLKQNIITLTLK